MQFVNPTDFGRRAGAVIAGVTADTAADDTLELPLLRGERTAGRLLTRFVVSAALLTALAVVLGAVLAWLGLWQPLVVTPALVVLAVLSWRLSVVVPTRALPIWTALALLVISMVATTWAGLTHDEQVLPRDEAGVNAQAGVLLAQRHEWPMPLSASEVGVPQVLRIPGLTIGSNGFRAAGPASDPVIEPQTLIGAPIWLSLGYWAGGVNGLLWVPALFGGLGVLALGLLTSSVVGPRWGPLGALGIAIAFPMLHAARSTSAESVVVFMMFTGLLLLVAATRAGARGRRKQVQIVGLLAGALVASGSFFRPEAFSQTVVLLLVAVLLVTRGDRAGAPAIWGAGAATAVSALIGGGLSGTFLQDQWSSLTPLGFGLPSRQAFVWMSWWTGPFALAITALVVAAGVFDLTRAWRRGEPLPVRTGVLALGFGAAVLALKPASVVSVSFIVVCVAMAAAWVTRLSTRRLPALAAVVISVGTAATLLVPEVASTLPHAHERVSQGEVAAVQKVCRAFGPADVVLMVDQRAGEEWLPTVRATCDVPALSLSAATRRDPGGRASAVAQVSGAVKAGGGRLVVMAAGSVAAIEGPPGASPVAGVPVIVVNTRVTHDPAPTAGRPDGLPSFPVQVWLASVG